jgi:hypothetical protein
VVRSSKRGRGTGPPGGRRARGVEIILQQAVNPGDRYERQKKEVKIRKEMEYGMLESVVEKNGE